MSDRETIVREYLAYAALFAILELDYSMDISINLSRNTPEQTLRSFIERRKERLYAWTSAND